MNFDLTPLTGTQRTNGPTRSTPAGAARAATGKTPRSDQAVNVSAVPSTPPEEVLDAIGVASNAYDQLAASGKHVHFAIDQSSGRVVVELHDANGGVLSSMSPGDALSVAGGASID